MDIRDERQRILRGEFPKGKRRKPAPAPEPSAASRRELEEVVHGIEISVDEMAGYLAGFYRSAIAKVAPDTDLLDDNSHLKSRFGAWYSSRDGKGVFGQPAFEALAAAHQGIHAHVRILVGKAWKDDALPVEEVDALHEKVQGFYEQARRLARAFRAALSDLDPLTGVNTRQAMLRDLDKEAQRSRRSGHSGVLALADIDHFKKINDSFGHQTGDTVLATVTAIMQDRLRPYDSVYRYGGEEFLILLPETSLKEAALVLDRVREAVAGTGLTSHDDRAFRITVSFGLSLLDGRDNIETVTEQADRALYSAKENGRNQVRVWSDEVASS